MEIRQDSTLKHQRLPFRVTNREGVIHRKKMDPEAIRGPKKESKELQSRPHSRVFPVTCR